MTETDTDTEAPYGYHADGTPKRSNGGRPKGSGARATGKRNGPRARAAATAPTRKASPNAAPKPQAAPTDYTEAFSGIVSIVGAGVSTALPLDGYVLLTSANDVGIVMNDLAQINKYVRQIGDRALQVGPYGGLVTVLMRIGAQVAENHQWAPSSVTTKFGAIPRAQLIRHIQLEQQMHEAQNRAAEQASAQMNFGQPGPSDVPPFFTPEASDAYAYGESNGHNVMA